MREVYSLWYKNSSALMGSHEFDSVYAKAQHNLPDMLETGESAVPKVTLAEFGRQMPWV